MAYNKKTSPISQNYCEVLNPEPIASNILHGKKGWNLYTIFTDFGEEESQITDTTANFISESLRKADIVMEYSKNLIIASDIRWDSESKLIIKSKGNIQFAQNVSIHCAGKGVLELMAGYDGKNSSATILFEENSNIQSNGIVKIYYNPKGYEGIHKYINPESYVSRIAPFTALESYFWINNAQDLQDMKYFLSGNYALSCNIDGKNLQNFIPIGNNNAPFTGNFNGNGHKIENFNISTPNKDQVGIFGIIAGTKLKKVLLDHLTLQNITIQGNDYLAILSAEAEHVVFSNIRFEVNNIIAGTSIAGSLVGSGSGITISNVTYNEDTLLQVEEFPGKLAGALRDSIVFHNDDTDVGICVNCIWETM